MSELKETESKFWMFTINNPLNSDFENIPCQYMVHQLEEGEKKTVHVQGYVCFPTNHKFNRVLKLFQKYGGHKPHIEKRRGKHSEAKGYCTKNDTRIDGPYEVGTDEDIAEGKGFRSDLIDIRNKIDSKVPEKKIWSEHFGSYTRYYKGLREYKKLSQEEEGEKYLKEEFSQEKVVLKPWQQEVCELLGDQTDRKILWIYDKAGNNGKTYLAKAILANFNCFYTKGGKVENIAYNYNYEEYVIFDFPRDKEEYINYSSIEQFKDGFIQSTKYEPVLKVVKPAKVLCLANFLPEKDKLSLDRWEVKKLSNGELFDCMFDLNSNE